MTAAPNYARTTEDTLLKQCASASLGLWRAPCSQVEANVYHVAARLVHIRHPDAAHNLMQAADAYFAKHPDEHLDSAEVIRRGWIVGLPRLRDRLERLLNRQASE